MKTPTQHRRIRPPRKPRARLLGVALVLAAATSVMFAVALPALAAGGVKTPTTPTAPTTIFQKKLRAPGSYTVMVTVKPGPSPATVNVQVAGQSQNGVPLNAGTDQELVFFVKLKTRKLVVRAASSGGKVGLSVATASEAASVAAPTMGPYHKLVWSDDFKGPAGTAPNPANWSTDSNSDCGAGTLSSPTSSLANSSLDGNGLGITALYNPAALASSQYTSAQLDTNGHYSFTYGSIQARIELPTGLGLCSAFWLLQSVPAGQPCTGPCAEIDILENVSPTPAVGYGSIHGPVQISNNLEYQGHVTGAQALSGSFHTWGVIWSPGRITWTLDGLPYATITPSSLPATAQWVYDTPMRIIFDLAVGGFWALDPTSTAGFPATLRVDWVRVYQ